MESTITRTLESTFHIDPADIGVYVPSSDPDRSYEPGTARSWYPRLWLNLNRADGRWDIILAGMADDEKDVIFEVRDQPDLSRLGEAFAALFVIAEREEDVSA